jgi:hypothetical protein
MTMNSSRSWGSFFGWVTVGVTALAGLLAAFAIPVFLGLLAISGAGALALISRKRTRVGCPGILCGCAIPLLFVAYLNRDGPGEVCTSHIGVACASSEQQSSPWPWVIAGLILLTVGIVASIASKWTGREDEL